MFTLKFYFYAFIALNCPLIASSWDSDDFELFDLIEEVNENFYDVLGVGRSTDAADLKRAYRKLSLQLHPDRNKELDAEFKFRQLVAVFEVLKDPKKRARYDEVLVNGLPDWRQPVYYYRRVRKMGLLELSILLTIILTVGHFITVWSIYIEQRFEKQEVYRSKKKRDKKSSRRAGRQGDNVDDSEDEELEAQLRGISRPRLSDLLPCLIARLFLQLVISLPGTVKDAAIAANEWRKTRSMQDDELDDENTGSRERTARRRPVNNLVPIFVETLSSESKQESKNTSVDQQQSSSSSKAVEGSEWSEAEIAVLVKAVARYPGGVTDRWEKISIMVGRSVKEVCAMSRQVKSHCARSVDPAAQGITATALLDSTIGVNIAPSDVSTRDAAELYCQQEPSKSDTSTGLRARNKPKVKSAERTLMITQQQQPSVATALPSDGAVKALWSQQQQRALETAIGQFPKSLADRWDRVADMVPGKTKEECILRFKHLAELVKSRKQQTLQNSTD